MADQIVPQLTKDEQTIFDIISEIVIPLCTDLKGIIAWNHSFNLLRVLVIAKSINVNQLYQDLPRGAEIGSSSITTACISMNIEIVIRRFLQEVYSR